MELHDFLAALGIMVGWVGIVLVFLPGLAIQVGTVALWAWVDGSTLGWLALGVCVLLAGASTFLKYQRPGRRLKEWGMPSTHLMISSAMAIVGFFVIPIIGAPIGFVLTIYVLALARLGRSAAWPATKAALKAILHSTGIELAGGSLIAIVWVVAAATI